MERRSRESQPKGIPSLRHLGVGVSSDGGSARNPFGENNGVENNGIGHDTKSCPIPLFPA